MLALARQYVEEKGLGVRFVVKKECTKNLDLKIQFLAFLVIKIIVSLKNN